MRSPVLLLFFNRPAQAAAVFDRVRAARPERLYVHVDGPRASRAGEEELVKACQRLVEKVDWPCSVKTLFRPENLGLRAGVSDALNWFFSEEAEGIILEDDCLPDPSFFEYCDTLLEYYRDHPQVMHIAGSNVAANAMRNKSDSFFVSRFSLVWGWASWRRAWQQMSLELEGLEEYKAKDRIREFSSNPMAQAYMLDKFEKTRAGLNKSWAYAWFYTILNLNGRCIVPAVNLIENVGVGDADATNTTNNLEHLKVKAGKMAFPLSFPDSLEPQKQRESALFYHTQKQKWRLFIWYALHLLGLR